jgi:hypothetical protein
MMGKNHRVCFLCNPLQIESFVSQYSFPQRHPSGEKVFSALQSIRRHEGYRLLILILFPIVFQL